jgi:serralysin
MSELKGGELADRLDGTIGNDTIWGYSGDDTINGLEGDDKIITGNGADMVDGGPGNDVINGSLTDGVVGYYPFAGIKTIEGGEGDDLIYGASKADYISGGAGNDKIEGLAGNDVIIGGDGNDTLIGGTDSDSLVGGAGDDVLKDKYSGTDTLLGGAGNDSLDANTGTDSKYLDGGDGDDTLRGGNGSDTLIGGADTDLLVGYVGDDILDGGLGNDILYGLDGNDSLEGGDGDDNLLGYEGNDFLTGDTGNDSLTGSEGDDTLAGGEGTNTIDGGKGNDTYYIDSAFDRITDSAGTDTAIVSIDWFKVSSAIENVSYINGARALPYWVSALIHDDASGQFFDELIGSGNAFLYAFPSAIPSYDTSVNNAKNYTPFNATQKANTKSALNYIASIIDVQFTETNNPAKANTLAFASNAQVNSGGYATYPGNDFADSDVFLNNADYNNSLNSATSGAHILIHEIGHALGLKHPFDEADVLAVVATPPYLQGDEDRTRWTQMSYTESPEEYVLSFSALDIAALQYVYGPSITSRAGNDSYKINNAQPHFIWDGAGLDTIDASAATQGVTLFLEAGEWGYFGQAKASTITTAGQVTVNFGTVMENARGTAHADRITGNQVANQLQGGSGADVLNGLAGNDSLDGGNGQDTAVYALAASSYAVTSLAAGGYQVVAKTGTEGSDTLLNIESLKFSDQTGGIAGFVGKVAVPEVTKFWKNNALTPSETKKIEAVSLSDAIAILKMIVGLNVNSINVPLSPYQAIAADFDQNGAVELSDAIGLLKMVVGLAAPTPTWKYFDDAKLSYNATQSLNHKAWSEGAAMDASSTADQSVKLIGVLTGDVDGSWSG